MLSDGEWRDLIVKLSVLFDRSHFWLSGSPVERLLLPWCVCPHSQHPGCAKPGKVIVSTG